MADVFVECLVKKVPTGRERLIQWGGTLLLAALGAVLIVLGGLYFLTLLLALACFAGAYYFFTLFQVEYEYAVTNGEMDFDQITAKRSRKRLLTIQCAQAEAFGRYSSGMKLPAGVQKTLFLGRNPSADNQYYFVVPHPEKGKLLVVFQGEEKCLRAIRPFVPRRVVALGTWEDSHAN